MQDAKDSFYEMLRGRLQAMNPDRTIAVRGTTRPGVLVDENEVHSASVLVDCFHLRWGLLQVKTECALPLLEMTCEIAYATSGSPEFGGLDRGRSLAAMDAELIRALGQSPQNAIVQQFSVLPEIEPSSQGVTRFWWSDVALAQVTNAADRLSRTATVTVMCFGEGVEA